MARRAPLAAALCALGAVTVVMIAGCDHDDPRKPLTLPPAKYQQMVSAFYTGVAGLEAQEPDTARKRLVEASQIEPREPATWLNLAVLDFRGGDLAKAAENLKKARESSPPNARIELLSGYLAGQQGRAPELLEHLKTAARLEPDNLHILYALVDQLRNQPGPEARADMERWMDEILRRQPRNLPVLLDSARGAAAAGNAELLRKRLDTLKSMSAGWSTDAMAEFRAVEQAAAHPTNATASSVARLSNVLKNTPAFRQGFDALTNEKQARGEPMDRFLRLPVPSATPAAADMGITFTPDSAAPKGTWAQAARLAPGAAPQLLLFDGAAVTVNGTSARLAAPGAVSPEGALLVDWNNDRFQDLALAGAAGLRLYQQNDGQWKDVTAASKLPADVLSGAYTAAYALDLDLDGDLDLVLARTTGAPVVLRNNGDGTWTPVQPFAGLSGVRSLVWADLDNDGDPDVAFVDGAGKLVIFDNDRGGHYRRVANLPDLGATLALSAADADANGTLDLVALQADGAIVRLTRKDDGGWDRAELTRWQAAPADGAARLFWADLDNNGALDLVATGAKGTQVWLGAAGGALQPLAGPVSARVLSIDDLNNDGRLDLVGLDPQGAPVTLLNKGTAAYSWQNVQLRSKDPSKLEDKRSNTFGIGGEVALRSGLLLQKQLVTGPLIHFGLGQNPSVNFVRIVWPAGSAQAEFDFKPGQTLEAEQRLNTSCPWLFADDGTGVHFVTDILWSSPLGLRINAQDTAGVVQTRDWVKIRGDQLKPRNGYYDLRVTGELWETDIFDYFSLMTVDHPAGTEVYLDERFSIPPPELRVRVTNPAQPFARALDEAGKDVSDVVRARDGRYLDTFGHGRYQGVAKDHWVELELPAAAPASGPLHLLAYGWVHPTDSSINVAISQGSQARPQPLSLQVPDGAGGWRTVKPNLGFPAGKNKTIIVDLTGVFPSGQAGPRRLRLRTNLEVYWDQLAWATPRNDVRVTQQEIKPDVAELRYRGFSYVHQANLSTPDLPDYNHVRTTGQMWRDLIGYYTRFGDVRELLAKVDDRYVLLNAGDEIALRFKEQPAPPAGWVRDYVFISDGWDKDGNLNTGFSKTLLPLPLHDRPEYSTPPTRLEDDPAYRRHPEDWKTYHTRYVTPDAFRHGLWGASAR